MRAREVNKYLLDTITCAHQLESLTRVIARPFTGRRFVMLRKTMIVLASALALGSATLSTNAFARGGGGGGIPFTGGGSHMGGSFGGGHLGTGFGGGDAGTGFGGGHLGGSF